MAPKEMEVVRNLDLQRYMGRWYEIASFPSRFQPKNGVSTRATYTLNEDGTVHVLNETWSDGKRGYIEGTAFKADLKSDEAKLKVRFYVPPFLPIIPITGDYWVLFIDEDYQYALIGQPSRNYLWILCRQTHLDEEIYNQLVERAAGEGYDVKKLHKTAQSDPPPEAENSPQDTKGFWWIKSLLATEWVKGKPMEEVLAIKNTEIAKHLSLPPVKLHCSMLAEDAIKAAVKDYEDKRAKMGAQVVSSTPVEKAAYA